MAKRKTKLVPETIPIDSAISNSEVLGHQISEHAMSLCEKMTKEEAEDKSSSFALSYSCQQLNRRVKPKNAISKKKKLGSGAFESHLGNLWGSFSEDKRTSFAYLDCLWFALYLKPPYKDKVLTWIKRKHIFSKKNVFVPIICWSHWSLLIFCHFGESLQSKTRTPCMLLLDSLEMGNPRFVLDIYEAEGTPENPASVLSNSSLGAKGDHQGMLSVNIQVPQQRNGEECGQFVLYFMTLFMEGAPEGFSIEDYPYFMKKNWFTSEGLDSFCQKLDSLKKGN